VDRTTRDLDLFAPGAGAVQKLLGPLEKALVAKGFEVRRLRVTENFARLAVDGKMLAAEELAVDKLLALFDRAEARDFVDFAAVVDDWGLEYLCGRALEKDAGFDRQTLAEQLGRFDRLPDRVFPISPDELPELRKIVRQWRHTLTSES